MRPALVDCLRRDGASTRAWDARAPETVPKRVRQPATVGAAKRKRDRPGTLRVLHALFDRH